MTIKLARGLELPLDAVTQIFGFIGRRGAGKTYAAGVLAEGLLGRKAQVVVLDPIGNWYGLRLAADGKKPGLPIPILGGLRGDIPLEPAAGGLIAKLVVDKRLSAVIDVSQFRKGKRKDFVAAFAEELFHRMKRHPSAMHLVVEEAQVFCPQRPGKGDERMLGAMEDIVRLGRNYGIGTSLVSQRPQSVNKEVLNQVEALVVLQVNGAHERKAIEAWVVHQGLDVSEMVDELPSLPVGTAFFWSPQWLDVLKKVRISKKLTFDASATPKLGQRAAKAPRNLAKVEIAEMIEAMADVVKRADESDPKKLQKRIRELERKLVAAEKKAEKDPVTKTKVEHVEVPVLSKEGRASIKSFVSAAERVETIFRTNHMTITNALLHHDKQRTVAQSAERRTLTPDVPVRVRPVQPSKRVSDNGEVNVRAGARRMLACLANFYPGSMTKRQVAGAAKMKSTGGTFNQYWSEIRKLGLIEEVEGRWRITEDGAELIAAQLFQAPGTLDERMDFWRSRLRKGARNILDVIQDQQPIDKESIAAEVEMTASGGTFNSYLGLLRVNGLIDRRDGCYYLSEWLVTGGQ